MTFIVSTGYRATQRITDYIAYIRFSCCKEEQVVKLIWHKATSPPHTDGSVVFANWRQCAPHLIHGCLDPPDSAFQISFRLVQPFLHSSRQGVYILYNEPPFSPQHSPSHGGCESPIYFMVSWAHPSPHTKWRLHRLSRFCRAPDHDRPTDRQTTLLHLLQ